MRAPPQAFRPCLLTRTASQHNVLSTPHCFPYAVSAPFMSSWCLLLTLSLLAGSCDALTEGAFHFGRLKNVKQAAYLVQRYQKFAAALPVAEADLEQQLAALDRTPQQDKEEFIHRLKGELQVMARGEH